MLNVLKTITGIVLLFIKGCIFSIMWSWFIVETFSVTGISILQAFGVLLLLELVKVSPNRIMGSVIVMDTNSFVIKMYSKLFADVVDEKDRELEYLFVTVVVALLTYITIFFVGLITRLLM